MCCIVYQLGRKSARDVALRAGKRSDRPGERVPVLLALLRVRHVLRAALCAGDAWQDARGHRTLLLHASAQVISVLLQAPFLQAPFQADTAVMTPTRFHYCILYRFVMCTCSCVFTPSSRSFAFLSHCAVSYSYFRLRHINLVCNTILILHYDFINRLQYCPQFV